MQPVFAFDNLTKRYCTVAGRDHLLLHPLSRARQAQLAFWSGLVQNASFCASAALVLLVLGLAAGAGADIDIQWPGVPGFVLPLTLVFAFLPLGQWYSLRYGPALRAGKRSMLQASLIFAGRMTPFVGVVVSLFVLRAHSVELRVLAWPVSGQLLLLAVLALVIQLSYYQWLRVFYRKGDLIS